MISVRRGYLHLAIHNLRSSRTRTFMTMLGIVIAVTAVIVVVSIGQGVKEQIGNQVARYGKDVLLVRPNQTLNGLTGSGLPGGTGSMLTADDLQVLRNTKGVQTAVPLSAISGTVTGDYKIEHPLVIATTADLGGILNQKIDYGGFFANSDGDHVAVLGTDIAHKLFSDNAPLGQKFAFRGQDFVVAGVFKRFAAAPFSLEADYNQAVFIPYQTAQSILKTAPQINQIFVQSVPDMNETEFAQKLETALTTSHGGSTDAVVLPPGAKAANSNHTLQLLTLMTVGIAIVALVVGGVGIMNMMLVSVTERIHEIGIRKAIGATNKQILRQFTTEAFALSIIGSVVGVLLALGIIGLLRLYTTLSPVIVWPVIVITPIAALITGVFFGTIPAVKASRMDPIDALRYE